PHFIGVWDTVSTLGYFYGKRFFDETLNPDIKFAYQAISIDESRKKFLPSIWRENKKVQGQLIEQVWFSGSHSDVGGWYDERG
ncbi:T6SS phospholipase effector Tle1-like catalytic domain-containing protein, partial [Xanthovirga aplysinae]|uniref:phospholipase effector Tle1 domain-containing protein n=1 Tax=Xanthovirga aplysinae TaxID=2529853 RepID=UPI00165725CE